MPGRLPAGRSTANTRSSSFYTSGSTGKPKGILTTTAGYLLGVSAFASLGLRSERGQILLVHSRHRLGDWPQPYHLRSAGQRATSVMYEGAPKHPAKKIVSGR